MGSIPQNGISYVSPQSLNFGKGVRVAVVGAGVSGICAGAHLIKQGADVTVFERSGVSSGVWHFDPRVTNSPTYPSETPSVGDYVRSRSGRLSTNPVDLALKQGNSRYPLANLERDDLEIAFAPPGPCYAGLKNNVPTTLLYSSLGGWPAGTDEITGHLNIERYLQTLSAENGVDDVTLFHTRVEDAKKTIDGTKWIVKTITLLQGDGSPPVVERTWEFDALVIASGHYNLPRVPDIPGLAEWKALFGDRVIHSKEYRHAETYRGKNIFIIGGGTSALDVCRETHEVAKIITQSTRGGDFDLPKVLLPPSAQRVGGIEKFIPDPDISTKTKLELESSVPIPGQIILKDGQVLKDIDNVIVATGYITSYPFLSQFHFDNKPLEEAGPETLVTSDGNMVHNLYKDIFYIEDPSLAFIGVPYHNATFSLFDFQAQAVARVLTGKTRLPERETLRHEYEKLVNVKGLGRKFHSLAEEGAEIGYVKDLVDWVNRDALDSKAQPMEGHTEEWLEIHREAKALRALIRKGNGDESFAPSWP